LSGGPAGNARPHERAPDGNEVFWPEGAEPGPRAPFRGLSFGEVERDWPDVSYPEKPGLNAEVLRQETDDVAAEVAQRIGYARTTARFREETDSLVAALQGDDE